MIGLNVSASAKFYYLCLLNMRTKKPWNNFSFVSLSYPRGDVSHYHFQSVLSLGVSTVSRSPKRQNSAFKLRLCDI